MSSTGWCLLVLHKSLSVPSFAKPFPAPWGGSGGTQLSRPQQPALPLEGPPRGLQLRCCCWLPCSSLSQSVGPVFPAGLLPAGRRTAFPWLGDRKGSCSLGQGTVGAAPRPLFVSSSFVMFPSRFSVSHDHSTMTMSRRPSGIRCNLCSHRAAILKRLQRTLK